MTIEKEISDALATFLSVRGDRVAISRGLVEVKGERSGTLLVEVEGISYTVDLVVTRVDAGKPGGRDTSRPPSKRS